MATVSNLDAILQQMQTTIAGLALDLNAAAIPVFVKKLPKREEAVDPPVQIVVSVQPRGEDPKPFAFGVGNGVIYKVGYPILVTLIAPSNDDQVKNLQAYTGIRQTIRLALKTLTAFASVPAVWDLKVKPEVFLDRAEIPLGYDYMAQLFEVTTVES